MHEFFKRLKDKFSTKSTEDIEKELTEDEELDQPSTKDNEQENEEPAPKEKPRKLSEADFDEDGLISIEDFEEIEAQKWERSLKQV